MGRAASLRPTFIETNMIPNCIVPHFISLPKSSNLPHYPKTFHANPLSLLFHRRAGCRFVARTDFCLVNSCLGGLDDQVLCRAVPVLTIQLTQRKLGDAPRHLPCLMLQLSPSERSPFFSLLGPHLSFPPPMLTANVWTGKP